MTGLLAFVLVDSLVAWRLTTLVVSDTITAPARRAIAKRYHRPASERIHLAVVLLFCGRCLSVWVAAAVVLLVHPSQSSPTRLAALWWSTAAGAAILDRWDNRA